MAELLLVLVVKALLAIRGLAGDPEIKMNATELIQYQGYRAEVRTVNTSDGYVLEMHRIPCPRNAVTDAECYKPRPVVFLQHGLLCSSTNWLTNLVNESFAYLLADHGFDVWMGNVRGNTYSRCHEWLRPDDKEFWKFRCIKRWLLEERKLLSIERQQTVFTKD